MSGWDAAYDGDGGQWEAESVWDVDFASALDNVVWEYIRRHFSLAQDESTWNAEPSRGAMRKKLVSCLPCRLFFSKAMVTESEPIFHH